MLLLFESPAGFALFKVLDEGKLKQADVRAPLNPIVPPSVGETGIPTGRCASAGVRRHLSGPADADTRWLRGGAQFQHISSATVTQHEPAAGVGGGAQGRGA